MQPAVAFYRTLAGMRDLGPAQQRHEGRPVFGLVDGEAAEAGQVGG